MRPWLLACLAPVIGALGSACSDSGGPSPAIPVAKFSAVCAALRCDFTDQSTAAVPIAGWSWDFGDGATATARSGFHVYAEPATYGVSLTVTDSEGRHATVRHNVVATAPVVAHLSCADGSAPGGLVRCTLQLGQEAGFKVTLTARACSAHGNIFRIIAPVVDTLTTDGCYEQPGTERVFAGPFAGGTEIDAEVIAPQLANPPQVVVNGAYPEWTLSYEDGMDTDFNDLSITITAMPTGG
jgi:PKD repeat protein